MTNRKIQHTVTKNFNTMITFIILLYNIPSAQNSHIIFEEIGDLTGPISYLHIVVPINIQGLNEKAK